MKIEVSRYEKKYIFELDIVAQICGQNIPAKTYIFESIRRYFSTYKYSEEHNHWRDNVLCDGQNLGRKYFCVYSIKQREDILNQIKMAKKSIFFEYLQETLQKFTFQEHLAHIDEELERIYIGLNEEIESIGDIRLSYDYNDVWNMVQSSYIETQTGEALEDKSSYELICIFLRTLKHLQEKSPKKILVLLENLDHMLTREQYLELIDEMYNLGKEYNIRFICSTSLNRYVKLTPELCENIYVCGKVDFNMPDIEHLLKSIKEQYPYEKIWDNKMIISYIEQAIQCIGQDEYLVDIQANVISKILNSSLLISEKRDFEYSSLELAYLRD